MRRLAALLAAIVAATTLAPANAAVSPVLRLSGRSTGYVDLTLVRPTTFDEWRARLTTRGTYVAWWITRVGEPVTSRSNHAGSLKFVRHEPASPYPDFTVGFRSEPLDPGRYLLYLATDGESTVEVTAKGLPRSLSLKPSRSTTSVGATATLGVMPGGFVYGSMREPATFGANSLAVSSVVAYSAPGATVESLGACIAPSEKSCDEIGASGYAMSLFTDFSVGVSVHYNPGTLPPGRYDGRQGVTAGPGVTRVVGSLFQLTTIP